MVKIKIKIFKIDTIAIIDAYHGIFFYKFGKKSFE
jgi:hypothetical protein